MAINGGITIFLEGFSDITPLRTSLSVNNLNTGPGTAVTLNIQTSVGFRGLGGVVAVPSSGTNTATVNLVGSSTELTLSAGFLAGGTYAGTIAGSGGVTYAAFTATDTETFSGNNTYTGTTTVNGGTLRVDGTTSGQGNYVVATTAGDLAATLTGSGRIGLAANGTLTVGGGSLPSQLSAGADSAAGTLAVVTSGTGGVIFGEQSVFLVDIGPAGASDRLAITGGHIDLTSSTDTLNLNSLTGGFDGSSYTIATFRQNLGAGTFNTVTGLPPNYMVVYARNSIMVVPAKATLSLTPNSGPPGTSVQVKGSGFAPSEQVKLSFTDAVTGRTLLGNFTTDATGAFTAQVMIPSNATVGAQTITATGATSGQRAKAKFTVT